MNGDNTYEERNSIATNQGEELFLQWCRDKKVNVTRLGFDEKQGKVDHFYTLPSLIRNLPDFVITDKEKAVLINVKGSFNFKHEEYLRLDEMSYHFENDRVKLWYVIARPDGLTWLTIDALRQRYENSKVDGIWPDGKRYRTL